MSKCCLYKQSADYAQQNGELALYQESNRKNIACAVTIEKAIKDCNYELYRYDFETAAKKVILEYGSERVAWVLAATLQYKEYDGRFSRDNKSWGNGFSVPKEKNIYYTVKTHPHVLDGFIDVARKALGRMDKFLDLLRSGEEMDCELIIGGADMPASFVWGADCKITDYGIEKYKAIMEAEFSKLPNGNIVIHCDDDKLGENFCLAAAGYIGSSEYDRIFASD